jgi:hypothetical protein
MISRYPDHEAQYKIFKMCVQETSLGLYMFNSTNCSKFWL